MLLACAVLLVGCVTPVVVPAAAPQAPAHLIVINVTDYEWRLVIARSAGATIKDARLQSRATLAIDLAGGDYVIEQSVLGDNATPEMARKIPVSLASGQTYRWRLVTLLSEPAGNGSQ
jgi:hypothetical protein